MKRILLFAVASLLMLGASAQPPQGPRGPEFRGPQGHFFAPEGMPKFEAPKDFQAPAGFRASGEFQGSKDFKGPKGFPGPRADFGGRRGPQGPRDFRHEPPKDIVVVQLTDDEVAERFARRLRLKSENIADFAPILTAFRAELKEVEAQYPVTFKPRGPRGPKAEQPTEAEIEEMKAQREQFVARHKAEKAVEDAYRDRFFEVMNHRQYHWMFELLRDRGMFVKFERIQSDEPTQEEETARETDNLAAGIGSVEQNDAEKAWYSVDGARVTGQPTKAGIYVVDGKKVLVR